MNQLTLDIPKNSRFQVINAMREKVGRNLLVWEKFVQLDWKMIEQITEKSRVQYNKWIEDSNKKLIQ